MYLHQKLKYNYKHITDEKTFNDVLEDIKDTKPYIVGFDTETTGLNIITDKPFLVSFGYANSVYTFDYNPKWFSALIDLITTLELPLFAHNAKFDYHMVQNGGSPIPNETKLYDSITVARLTENADEKISMSLEALGTRYIDSEAKFAGAIIMNIIKKIDKERRTNLVQGLMDTFSEDGLFTITKKGTRKSTGKLSKIIKDYDETRTKWVNDDNKYFQYIDEHFKRANYKDVYDIEPELMINYAADDIVIMLEYLNKALPVLSQIDKDFTVLKREGELIKAVACMENTGFKVDVDYILESRKKIVAYRELLYLELYLYTGKQFTVAQHKFIKNILLNKFKVKIDKADEKHLKGVISTSDNEILQTICKDILELRTLDKWLSTYVDGKLNSIINGRIYTDINNSGAVSGRVSCNMQQQPKDGLYDRDGQELFHPRKMFICDEGHRLFFIDRILSM